MIPNKLLLACIAAAFFISINITLAIDEDTTEEAVTVIDNSELIINIYDSLYNAIGIDSADEVKQLIDFGANINHRYKDGMTPIMYASSIGSIESTKVLIELGADLKLTSNKNMLAIDYAHENNKKSVFALLSKYRIEEVADSTIILEPEAIAKPTVENDSDDSLHSNVKKEIIDTVSEKSIDILVTSPLPLLIEEEPFNNEANNSNKFPNIAGIYIANTVATLSSCGTEDKTIEYSAEESFNKISDTGEFNISYKSPFLQCTGSAVFIDNNAYLQGKYNCSYETEQGFQGTLKMVLDGSVKNDTLHIKYQGHDTSPGVSCLHNWERTITLNNR